MWVAVVGLAVLAVYVCQALLVIFGALVFATMLDGGARLLGRVLKIGRNWRLAIVLVAGDRLLRLARPGSPARRSRCRRRSSRRCSIDQMSPADRVAADARALRSRQGDVTRLAGTALSGVGTVTKAIGGIIGAVATVILILTIGLYIAFEPRLYERGIAWMLPQDKRDEFLLTADRMAFTLRRLMAGRLVGMAFEGVFIFLALAIGGVPLAALLGIITGLLAFIPNIGAIVSGILMVLVGFSGGTEMGVLHDHRLFRGAEHRWQYRRAADRPANGRPGARAGAGDAADHGHPVRHPRPVPRRSAAGDGQGLAPAAGRDRRG